MARGGRRLLRDRSADRKAAADDRKKADQDRLERENARVREGTDVGARGSFAGPYNEPMGEYISGGEYLEPLPGLPPVTGATAAQYRSTAVPADTGGTTVPPSQELTAEEMGGDDAFVPEANNPRDQIISRDWPSWKRALEEKFQAEGLAYDASVLADVVRNVSYETNAGTDPREFLDAAFRRIETRARSGGDRSRGGYDTGWADEDPARYATAATETTPSVASGAPSRGYIDRLSELQSSLDALPDDDTSGRAAIQSQIQNMYGGGYQPPPPPQTMADIVSPPVAPVAPVAPVDPVTPNMPIRGMATPTLTPRLQPYSARAVRSPLTANGLGTAVTPPRVAQPWASTPLAPEFMGTMGTVMSPPPAGVPTAPNWDTVNNDYWRASQDYVAGPNGMGFVPDPWSGTRRRLARTVPETTATVTDDATLTDDDADVRRAYNFGRRSMADNRYNADLRNRDFENQMDRWLRAYNQWNQPGMDPFNLTPRGRRF